MKASDYIAATLAVRKVPAVFELIGGMITHLVDSIHVHGKTRIISMRHEQGAAFAAEATGRITGDIPGVAMATSGPGATNLLTGIGSCYFDSSPAIFITGQVNRHEQKGSRAIRQLGFQETDIASMAASITKKVFSVTDAEHLPQILDDAFHIATSGRRGPVLIDIPMDVQRDQVTAPLRPIPSSTEEMALDESVASEILAAVQKSSKPLILAGGGIRSSLALDAFCHFAQMAQIPVVHSLMACDLLSYADPLNVGMIGSYGNRWANLALTDCDCLIVLGSRLDVRQTGSDVEGFKGTRPIFHIDCEPGEINNRVVGCVAIVSDLTPALNVLASVFEGHGERIASQIAPWTRQITDLREEWPDTNEFVIDRGINPNAFMHQLSKASAGAGAYVVDVGQHQMWAAQSLELSSGQRFLTSGGMGSMGFALPAAIGSAVCLGGQPVVMIAGDGSFQCNIQELETVAHLGLPIKMVVINNECHGMVRQFQESYFHSRFQSTMWGYSAPDFSRVAAAYGIESKTVSASEDIEQAVAWLASDETAPGLLQVMVDPMANAYPKLAFGRGMSSMEPHIQPLEMEGT
ncbi:MAG: thiamine pyrophosphate-binding protein [Acidobacteria bacterium]|nr:thiamine pyrophosphate-binding protein [Acidobacteriota bacterium]